MGAPFHQIKNFANTMGWWSFLPIRTLWGYVPPVVRLGRFAPELEVYSIDESFLNLTGVPTLYR